MQIAIVYTTNSGATFLVGKLLQDLLKTSSDTHLFRSDEVSVDALQKADLIFLGSPSWNSGSAEGVPTAPMIAFMERFKNQKFPQKAFAVFGCGDSSYTHFCGAVDELEHFVAVLGGTLVFPSLKIDGYFFEEAKHNARVHSWSQQVMTAFEYYVRTRQKPFLTK